MTPEQNLQFNAFCAQKNIDPNDKKVFGLVEVAKAAFLYAWEYRKPKIDYGLSWEELSNGGRLRDTRQTGCETCGQSAFGCMCDRG